MGLCITLYKNDTYQLLFVDNSKKVKLTCKGGATVKCVRCNTKYYKIYNVNTLIRSKRIQDQYNIYIFLNFKRDGQYIFGILIIHVSNCLLFIYIYKKKIMIIIT